MTSDPARIEITVFSKDHGPLTKRISLGADGKIVSDGSACMMASGKAQRARLPGIDDNFAELIARLKSHQGLVLGAPRPDLPDEIPIVTKARVNGGNNAVARTAANFEYRKGRPALVLFDYDTKGRPAEVKKRIDDLGGFWPALVSVIPDLGSVGYLIRASTSAGLINSDTGEAIKGSDGQHGYIAIKDGADVVRFLTTLHERCWLAGLGWTMVGNAGQLLERSIVDRMVGAPERLVFEGAPVVEPPLKQDSASRKPIVVEGGVLDSVAACPPLTVFERQTLNNMKAQFAVALRPEQNRAREAFIANHRQRLMDRTGMTAEAAAAVIEKQTRGILLASIELPFDDDGLAGMTVGDVLDNPGEFEGETLADPLEGVEYGRCKAKVMRGSGAPFINSFAHGHAIYQLRYDAVSIEKRINLAPANVAVETLIPLVLAGDLTTLELDDLIEKVKTRSNRGVKQIKAAIKAARIERYKLDKEEERQRLKAERNDFRPELIRRPDDSPQTEEMARINDAARTMPMDQQPRRDMEGFIVKPRWKPVPETHAFSGDDTADEEAEKPPEQWTFGRLDEYGLTEELERFLNYVDDTGRSVAPPWRLVKAFKKRFDGVLGYLVAIATQPIVLGDGKIIGSDSKYDPKRGIQFIVSDAIAAMVPKPEECTPAAVATAMEYLTDNWLVDVKTTYIGKCVAVSTALTIMERTLLPERPVFVVKAGRRECGKSTLIKMLIEAVTSTLPSGSAWTMDVNERRKSIMSYFLAGVPYILWDNIPRGFQISCPHIELSCSFSYFSDRLLGVTEMVRTACASIHIFTGNAIGLKGDLASRGLAIELTADRADPANRPFAHPFPEAWTIENRGEILRALYTVLLGNPTLKTDHNTQMQTRFPMWYRLVGSAVENAARQAVDHGSKTAVEVSFKDLFKAQREEDEDDTTLSNVLVGIMRQWKNADDDKKFLSALFTSKMIADIINNHPNELGTQLRELLFGGQPSNEMVTPDAVGRRLVSHVGNVVEFESPIENTENQFHSRNIVQVTKPKGGGGRAAKAFYVSLPLPDEKF